MLIRVPITASANSAWPAALSAMMLVAAAGYDHLLHHLHPDIRRVGRGHAVLGQDRNAFFTGTGIDQRGNPKP